jgi:hypothetical protein
MKTPFRVAAVALFALAATIAPIFADDYPNKPIKVISDSAPGSAIDVMFRMVMDRLGTELGQQMSRPTPPRNRFLTAIPCSRQRFRCSSRFRARRRTCR